MKLIIQLPSGSEVKDILNLVVVPINIIRTTTYNHMCLDAKGLSLTEEQLCAKLLGFNESHQLERSTFRLLAHTLTP